MPPRITANFICFSIPHLEVKNKSRDQSGGYIKPLSYWHNDIIVFTGNPSGLEGAAKPLFSRLKPDAAVSQLKHNPGTTSLQWAEEGSWRAF
ncbi:MAG: hypothetical protein H6Q52_458 [Deltaproteobacteria bacterium]|nr:hypothetical protein [Deltaproteobacteria bacterium]